MENSRILMTPKHSCFCLSGIRFDISHVEEFFNPNKTNLNPPHLHNCLEIFLNISSDASFFVNNHLFPLQYGDIILSMPNDIHVCNFNKSYTHEHFCLWIDVSENEEFFKTLFHKSENPLYRFDSEKQKQIIDLFFKLEKLCGDPESTIEKTICFLQILTFFEERTSQDNNCVMIPDTLQCILNDIHVNFSEIHHINQLTEKYFVSHATLNRWFRSYLHTSPREYLESKKLSHAVKLLTEGATVTEACINSGFPCCSHFIVLFKKKFGETPLKYKKGLNIKNDKTDYI